MAESGGRITASEVMTELRVHIAECTESSKNVLATVTDLKSGQDTMVKDFQDFKATLNRNAWYAIGAVALSVIGALSAVVLQATFFHRSAVTHEDLAAASHDRYTAQDAASDRQKQDDRDAQIMESLRELQSRPRH